MHVDAYRLDGPTELDDLDLDTDIDDAVTVVEWGEGVAESLSGDRLELSLHRHRDDARTVTVTPVGQRWRELDLGAVGSLTSVTVPATVGRTDSEQNHSWSSNHSWSKQRLGGRAASEASGQTRPRPYAGKQPVRRSPVVEERASERLETPHGSSGY